MPGYCFGSAGLQPRTTGQDIACIGSENFMQDHPQWRLLNETIVKEVTIGYKGLELPVQVKWRRA